MTRKEKALKYIKDYNLTQRNRMKYFTYRRQIVCHVLREEKLTLSMIGKVIERDHATVLWNLRAYDANIKYNDFRTLRDEVYLEGDLHKEQKPDKEKTLIQKVLLCENYWQLRKLQEEIKQEKIKQESYNYGTN